MDNPASSSAQAVQNSYDATFYRALFEQAGDAMLVSGPDGQYLDVNMRACEQLGYRRDELLRLRWTHLLAPERYARDLAQLNALFEGSDTLGELCLCRKDGQQLLMQLSAQPIADGHILCIARDITTQRRAEEALHEREQQLRQTMQHLPTGVLIATPEGRLLFRNLQLGVIFRYTLPSDDITDGLRSWPLYDPESGEPFLIDSIPFLSSFVLGKQVADHQIMILRGDGTWGCVSISATPIFDDSGAVMLCVATFIDITEQRQAEEALLESEARFRSMADTAPVLIWMSGEDGGRTFVNQRWLTYTGRILAEELGDGWAANIHPDDAADCMATYRTALSAHVPFSMDYRLLRADGRYRWVLDHGVPRITPEGSFVGYIGSCLDIDQEHRRAEEALRASEELYRKLVRTLPDPLIVADNTAVITYVSPLAYQLFGYEAEQSLHGRSVLEWIDPVERERVHNDIKAVLNGGSLANQEYWLHRENGSSLCCSISASCLKDARDVVVGLMLVIRDITELKQAAEAQAKLEEQLRQAQKMESIGRLAGGVAHDFNNLLTVIEGYADMMQEKLVQGDPLYEDLSQIRRASERAARLTRQLLAFSRKQILAPTTLDLNSLVTNMHQMLERVIGEDILLRIDLQSGLWPVLADPNQLEQVILNLVVNARDAMPAGGSLTIETRNIFVNGRDEGLVVDSQFSACVRLSVIDTGEGMDAETRARAFDPFFTTKPPGYGTGLGLSTVYGIIKQSNGDITVASEPGVGATFRIYLPPGVMSPESLSVPEMLPIFGYGNETILVVEDQPMVLDLVRVALHSHGYTILEAGNGSAALELASNHLGPIELLVTDIVMPQMGGLELAERLKELRPQIKVLFMSGYSDDAVERPRMLGEDVAFLPKPFSPSTLAATVYQLLARSEA